MGVKIPASFEDSTGTVVRLTGELEFDVPATPGQVLTADDPAVTASFADGGGSAPIQTGAGSPLGTVVPTGIGYLYIDTTNGGAYVATTADDTGWFALGGDTGNAPGVTNGGGLGEANLIDNAGGTVVVTNGAVALQAALGQRASMGGIDGYGVQVGDDGAGNVTVGFFGGVAPVVQPTLTALSTAADIVAALQALGLSG